MQEFVWTDETIERLRALWAEGHSGSEIGRRLGTSRNAIISKANRIKLPSRESPIIRGPKHVPAPFRPRVRKPREERLPIIPRLPTPKPVIAAPLPAVPYQSIGGRVVQCCWIEGDARLRNFCTNPSMRGRSYCQIHSDLVYIKPEGEEDIGLDCYGIS